MILRILNTAKRIFTRFQIWSDEPFAIWFLWLYPNCDFKPTKPTGLAWTHDYEPLGAGDVNTIIQDNELGTKSITLEPQKFS